MASSLVSQLRKVGFDCSGDIKDAKESINIFITQEDIDRGVEGNPKQCTAAQCLRRAMGNSNVAMFLYTAYVQLPSDPHITRYTVPQKLRDGVVKPQDNGGDPKPGTYTLQAPVGTDRLGEAAIRREKLRVLRIHGLAPPEKRQNKDGPIRHRIMTRWINEEAGLWEM